MVEGVYIVGFNGSPRKYGNTFKMLKVALLAAEREGARTRLINLYDCDIRPCLGCLTDEQTSCRYPCVIDDDMKWIYDEILKADGIIIATPVYWYNVSGPVKNFIDRLTAFENMICLGDKSWVEGKVAGVIAVGNDSGVIEVIANLFAVLNCMGFIIPPWALAYKNTMKSLDEERDRLLDAANVGRCLTIMAKIARDYDGDWYSTKLAKWLSKNYKRVLAEAEANRKIQEALREKLIQKIATKEVVRESR